MIRSKASFLSGQPDAFTKQPGSQPDVITIENALKQLQVLGINRAEIVTDNGYYSEKNLAELLYAHFDFITLIRLNIKWVKKELFVLKTLIEGGASEKDLSEKAAEKARKFQYVRRYGSKCTVTFNEKLIAAQKKYQVVFKIPCELPSDLSKRYSNSAPIVLYL